MAVRYNLGFLSSTGVEWDIELHDTAFDGDAADMGCGGLNIKYDGGSASPHSPLMPSAATVVLKIANETQQALIDDLIATGDESRFLVKIYRDGVFEWAGGVVADATSYEDMPYPYEWQLVASDGLALLKQKDYTISDFTTANNKVRLRKVISDILNLTPASALWGGSDGFIRYCTSFRENTYSGAATTTAFEALCNKRRLFEISNGGSKVYEPASVWLERILSLFGCRVYLSGGLWWVDEVFNRNSSSIPSVVYTKSNTTGLAVTSTVYDVLIEQVSERARMRGGEWGILPAARKVQYNYNKTRYTNLLAGIVVQTGSVGPHNTGYDIEVTPLITTMLIKGQLTATITNVDMANAQPYAILYGITIKVGSNYYRRDVTVSNFQIQYGNPYWSSTAGYYYVVHGFNMPVAMGSSATNWYPLEIQIPSIPSGGEFSFGVTITALKRQNGNNISGATLTRSFVFSNGEGLVLEAGYLTSDDDVSQYFAVNDEVTSNSETIVIDGYFADGPDINSIGALWVQNGAAYELTTNWVSGFDTTGQNIQNLITSEWMRFYTAPVQVWRGKLYAPSIKAHTRIRLAAGQYYLLQQGTYNANRDEWEGCELFMIARGSGSPIVSTGGGVITGGGGGVTNTGGIGGGLVQQGGTINLQGVSGIVAQIASLVKVTKVGGGEDDAAISGTVTSIPTADALKANALPSGATIMLISPASGAAETLTVDTASADGDTAISVVSQTLAYSYEVGSYIIASPADNFIQSGVGNGGTTAPATRPTYNSNDEAIADGRVAGQEYVAGSEHEAAAQGCLMVVF